MSSSKQMTGVGGKYLTFGLGDEEYGVKIENVHEIIALMPITRVPRTPDVVRGVINLRGKIVPVFDMHRKFGMTPSVTTRHTCIIVVSVDRTEVGIVVDRVREVVRIGDEQVEPPPSFARGSVRWASSRRRRQRWSAPRCAGSSGRSGARGADGT